MYLIEWKGVTSVTHLLLSIEAESVICSSDDNRLALNRSSAASKKTGRIYTEEISSDC